MAYLSWTPDFDVQVKTMNDQHKVLINIMEELYQLNEKKSGKFVLKSKLNELGLYTRKHFNDEEAYMESIGYEDLSRHKIIHEQLLSELDRYTEEFNNQYEILSESFFFFLKHWLTTHIRHIDIKYGKASALSKVS